MDPVSIGVAAAALVGSKAMEEFATQAGSTAWLAVQRMGTSVRSRLSPRGAHFAGDLADGGELSDAERAVLAGEIEDAVRADPGFRAELEGLVRQRAAVVAVARDHAKQVNIGGGNSGPITL